MAPDSVSNDRRRTIYECSVCHRKSFSSNEIPAGHFAHGDRCPGVVEAVVLCEAAPADQLAEALKQIRDHVPIGAGLTARSIARKALAEWDKELSDA